MHSFSITEHYYVLIEQPLSVRMGKVIANVLWGKPLISALQWRYVEVK
jgi:carotenoid isomerooxygenase